MLSIFEMRHEGSSWNYRQSYTRDHKEEYIKSLNEKMAEQLNKEEYIKSLNEKIAEQLYKILQKSTAENSVSKKPEDFNNINCLKCKF